MLHHVALNLLLAPLLVIGDTLLLDHTRLVEIIQLHAVPEASASCNLDQQGPGRFSVRAIRHNILFRCMYLRSRQHAQNAKLALELDPHVEIVLTWIHRR
jgi:hypothetical protein